MIGAVARVIVTAVSRPMINRTGPHRDPPAVHGQREGPSPCAHRPIGASPGLRTDDQALLRCGVLGMALLAGCATTATTNAGNPFPRCRHRCRSQSPSRRSAAKRCCGSPATGTGTAAAMPGSPANSPRSGHGSLFQRGYWQQTPSGWTWVAAHWTSSATDFAAFENSNFILSVKLRSLSEVCDH